MGKLQIQFAGKDWTTTEFDDTKKTIHGTDKDPDKFIKKVRALADKGYIIQPKRDGMQCAYISGHGLTRNPDERYLDNQYPELNELGILPSGIIMIGEIVCSDKTRSEHEWGQDNCGMASGRQGIASPKEVKIRSEKTPCNFIIFDVAMYEGEDVRNLPYTARYEFIKTIVKNVNAPNIQAIENIDGKFFSETECIKQKIEGYVAKDPEGNFKAQAIKLKAYTESDFVIVGSIAGKGKMSKTFGSLEIADPEGKPLLTSSGKPFTVSWKDCFNERWGSHYPTPEQLEIMRKLFASGTARARICYGLSTDPKSKIPRFPVLLDVYVSADKHYESD